MNHKTCVAMLLAGGQGSRLGPLTARIAKPAVSFGGKYRLIDFPLSSCAYSGIDTVGVLTQFRPLFLHAYLGSGAAWDLDVPGGGLYLLPPYSTGSGVCWYGGTADAVYRNLDFLRMYDPDLVLILSGDHLCKMDYRKMIDFHRKTKADLTIACTTVAPEDASRFGILTHSAQGEVLRFTEKPELPESCLASMGIYLFSYPQLMQALRADHDDAASTHDFGRDVIPSLLRRRKQVYAYPHDGYWQDIGTVDSYYIAQMDLLSPEPSLQLFDRRFPLHSAEPPHAMQHLGPNCAIQNALLGEGAKLWGTARNTIISNAAEIRRDAVVEDSVLLPGAVVEEGAQVQRCIVGEGAVVRAGVQIGRRTGSPTVLSALYSVG